MMELYISHRNNIIMVMHMQSQIMLNEQVMESNNMRHFRLTRATYSYIIPIKTYLIMILNTKKLIKRFKRACYCN